MSIIYAKETGKPRFPITFGIKRTACKNVNTTCNISLAAHNLQVDRGFPHCLPSEEPGFSPIRVHVKFMLAKVFL
jgi:hypothetical protein